MTINDHKVHYKDREQCRRVLHLCTCTSLNRVAVPCSHTLVAHDWSLQSQAKGSILVPIPHFLMSSHILPALVNFAPHEDKWSKYLLGRELCLHVAKGILVEYGKLFYG